MKKFLIMAMIAILTLGFSVTVFAADDEAKSDTATVAKGDTKITIGGEIRFRGVYSSNTSDAIEDGTYRSTYLSFSNVPTGAHYTVNGKGNYTNGTYNVANTQVSNGDDHQAYYDTRVRLSLDAKVSDTVEGFVELETGSNTTDTVVWGANGTGATGTYAAGNAKAGSLYLRQAWIQYAKSGFGVKVGHQPLILGTGLFFDHTKYGDDAIVAFAQPVKNLTIAALTAKFTEGTANLADDADAYVLLASYKSPTFNISGDVTYVDDKAMNVPYVTSTTTINTTTGWPTTTYSSTYGTTVAGYANAIKAHLLNFGLRADGLIGPVTLRGDVELQAGNIDYVIPNMNSSKFQGWAMLAGIDYKVINPVKLTLEFAYGSGDKSNTNDINRFITSQGKDQHYTFIYDYLSPSACSQVTGSDSTTSPYRNNGGLCNTMYLKGGIAADMTKALYGELNLYWLKAAQDVAIMDPYSDGAAPSTDIGWELDAKVEYKISKNLKYWVEGGYLWTGTAYNRVTNQTYGINASTFTAANGYPYTASYDYTRDNIYAIRHGIQLNF
ncbi:MAG: alginate export family protein [Nitrospirae bacterium]|nr:alginate export family protein [Nitrospirota bacterium]MBF0617478.1 alginate export family protein [Nitrospirota bacterium]